MTAIAISIGIALLGFLPLAIVLWKRRRMKKLQQEGDLVMGTVIDVTEHSGYKGGIYYRALIEYPVFNRAPLQGYYKFSGKKGLQQFYRGRKLEICYDKNKPSRFVPREITQHPVMWIFTAILAIVYIVICYLLYGTMKQAGI